MTQVTPPVRTAGMAAQFSVKPEWNKQKHKKPGIKVSCRRINEPKINGGGTPFGRKTSNTRARHQLFLNGKSVVNTIPSGSRKRQPQKLKTREIRGSTEARAHGKNSSRRQGHNASRGRRRPGREPQFGRRQENYRLHPNDRKPELTLEGGSYF